MNITGFIRVDSLVSNENAVVAPLGELSTYALSSSIEKSYFTDPTNAQGIELVTFRNRGLVTNTVAAAPTFAQASEVLKVANWIVQESLQGFTTDNGALFLQSLTAQFGSKITGIKIGDLVTDGQYYMPEWVRWQFYTTDSDGKQVIGDTIRIWFADDSFRRQYSQYDIAIIPPVTTLDDLHGGKAAVKALIESRDAAQLATQIAAITGKEPYTVMQAQVYDWIDKTDRDFKVSTAWYVVLWGPAGNNPDVIRDELVDYILANSSNTRAEWEKILPDLFISTEYIITPAWDQYSIPNQTLQAGLYSPLIKPKDALVLAKRGAPTYDGTHIETYARAASNAYRSLAFVAIGGIRNRDGIYDLAEKFSDYVALPTTHVDFNRVSPRTREWMLLFAAALKHAEEMTSDSEIPDGFARLTRNGIVYCAFSYEKIQYLVVTKQGLTLDNVELITEAPDTGAWLRVFGGWVETITADEFVAQLNS